MALKREPGQIDPTETSADRVACFAKVPKVPDPHRVLGGPRECAPPGSDPIANSEMLIELPECAINRLTHGNMGLHVHG